MAGRFEGEVALLTGAAGGIGRAAAVLFGREGAKVACADIDRAGLEETCKQVEQAGGEALALSCNVAERSAVFETVGAAVDAFGGLDVLGNIAGLGSMRHSTEVSEEEWSRVMSVNLNGTFFMSQAALPHLLEGGGCIVNIASIAGLIGQAYCAAYCASKAAVVGLTKALAVEYVKRGVRVNCICPAAVQTRILADFGAPEGADPMLLARLGLVPKVAQADEVAEAMAFLASDAAASINGVALPIDNGTAAA